MKVIASICIGLVFASGVCSAQDKPKACKPEDRRGGEIAEAIAGFQQAGAASAASTQNFFFDFYVSRPLPLPGNVDYPCEKGDDNSRFGPATRWWGNVRVASYRSRSTRRRRSSSRTSPARSAAFPSTSWPSRRSSWPGSNAA